MRGSKIDDNLIKMLGVNNNLLINSNFCNPVNQRGITATTWIQSANDMYGIDRWKMGRQVVTEMNSNGIKVAWNGITKSNMSLYQRIEKAQINATGDYTLSACVDGVIYSATFSMLAVNSKTDDEDAIGLTVGNISLAISHNDSVSGSEYVSAILYYASTTPITITWMKLEPGSISTPYIPRLYAEEMQMCCRYYRSIIDAPTALVWNSGNGYKTLRSGYNYGVQMRKPPTIKLISDLVLSSDGTTLFASNKAVGLVTTDNCIVTSTFASTASVGAAPRISATLDAEL